MMWTLFVLDFDGTYDNEYYGEYGKRPAVYQIPLEKQKEVEKLAKKASMEFNTSDDVCEPICDIFDGLLEENNIKYHCIGNLKIKFGDRQENYLDECIPRQIV